MYYVAMITNAQHDAWDGDVLVSNLKESGLPIASRVRPAKLATFDEAAIGRVIGSLPAIDRARMLESLRTFVASLA
jgi:mRNA interferase MazF